MELVEKIFFSGTFGGETISIAAAIAVINKYKKKNVVSKLSIQGEKIIKGTNELIQKYNLSQNISITGHPSWSFINFKPYKSINSLKLKTLFLQEVFARGIYMLGSHNLSYSHTDSDIDQLFKCYDQVFPILYDALYNENINKKLRCKPLKPLFKVR